MLSEPTPAVAEAEEMGRVLAEIAEALGARGAMLTLHGGQEDRLVHLTDALLDADLVKAAVADGQIDDARLSNGLHVWRDDAVLPGVRWMMSVPVQRVTGHPRLTVTAFFDDAGKAVQAQAEAAYLRRRPFAVGYFRLWQRERIEAVMARSFNTALELIDIAVLFVSERSELLYSNHAAQKLLDEGDGIRLSRGRVQPNVHSETSKFEVLLSHVLTPRAPRSREVLPLLRLTRAGRAPLIVSAHRDPSQRRDDEDGAAIVFIVDPAVDISRLVEPVCHLFGLSPVEGRLVALLAEGATIADAAASMHVKEVTARSYLKPIFAKTGTHRQSDLIRLILMSAIPAGSRSL